jgi:hypothetical protein
MSFERTKYCGHNAVKFVLFDENGTKYTVICPGEDKVILAGYALIVTDVDPPQKREPVIKLLVKEQQ